MTTKKQIITIIFVYILINLYCANLFAIEQSTDYTLKSSDKSVNQSDNIKLEASEPIKVFILAGDENLLEKAPVESKKPGSNHPAALNSVLARNPKYSFLRDSQGHWVTRNDVVLCDIHPIHNNTRATGQYLKVGNVYRSGSTVYDAIGPELMFGHVMGNQLKEQVLLLRFATGHPTWFKRGSRSLGHDYLPPSSGSNTEEEGNWDIIHFNWGVHDTAYRVPGNYKKKDKANGKVTADIDQYEQNLRKLVERLKKTGATLIWASTTPLPEGTDGWFKGDAVKYNAVAEKIMKENDVIIDDLYSEANRQGYPKRPDVHSVGNLAPKVTETILAALKERKNKTKPLPRVLLIGDSITGTYQNQVKNNLDGKAFVCKNPGNAENTWTGLAKIDQWLELKQYLLNGQEYLELVNGVKDTLAQIGRFCPDYKGQGYELSGLVWFQGIKDSQSSSMSNDYEKNLVNLINDLRNDFSTPDLPVAVSAVGYNGKNMRGNVLKVFNAQMTVSDSEKYPGFAHNVKSVDTRKFWPDDKLALKGREYDYKNNAESFLQIGQSLGKAMIELMNYKDLTSKKNTKSATPPDHDPLNKESGFIDVHVHAIDCRKDGLDIVDKWMSENNVDRCIILPLSKSRPENEQQRKQMLENYSKYKGRIDRYCVIFPDEVTTKEQAVQILAKEKHQGAIGFGEHYGRKMYFDDPNNMRLYAACQEVGLPVLFHMDKNCNLDEKGLPHLEKALNTYPDCIFIAHSGWWKNLADGTCQRLLQKYPNLYADVSAGVCLGNLKRNKGYTRTFLVKNSDKILFGTDCGWWTFGKDRGPEEHFSFFESLDLPAQVKAKIYRKNAQRLFGLNTAKNQKDLVAAEMNF